MKVWRISLILVKLPSQPAEVVPTLVVTLRPDQPLACYTRYGSSLRNSQVDNDITMQIIQNIEANVSDLRTSRSCIKDTLDQHSVVICKVIKPSMPVIEKKYSHRALTQIEMVA